MFYYVSKLLTASKILPNYFQFRVMSDTSEFIIGTHNGTFHCDEILACFMLLQLHPKAEIIRTRDKSVLSKCNIVVDVGEVYDHVKRKYDHHQKGFDFSMNNLMPNKPWNIKLSSAGLIYYHYGMDVLKKILKSEDESFLCFVFDNVYIGFVQEVDAIDNGVVMFNNEPFYRINTHLSSRVHFFNKSWNMTEREYDEEKSFKTAMEMVGNEFIEKIKYVSNVIFPARQIVLQAIENRFNIHESGKIIELSQFCPWEDHFYFIEHDMHLTPTIKYVLFKGDTHYRIRCIPIEPKSFICRQFLHEKWRGLSNKALSDVAGIEGCVFVHHTGFIGGNKTRNGAMQMALKSL